MSTHVVKTGTGVQVLTADGKVCYNGGQPPLIGILTDVTAQRHAAA